MRQPSPHWQLFCLFVWLFFIQQNFGINISSIYFTFCVFGNICEINIAQQYVITNSDTWNWQTWCSFNNQVLHKWHKFIVYYQYILGRINLYSPPILNSKTTKITNIILTKAYNRAIIQWIFFHAPTSTIEVTNKVSCQCIYLDTPVSIQSLIVQIWVKKTKHCKLL